MVLEQAVFKRRRTGGLLHKLVALAALAALAAPTQTTRGNK